MPFDFAAVGVAMSGGGNIDVWGPESSLKCGEAGEVEV